MIFAGLSVVAGLVILYYLFVLRAASSRALTVALGLIMAGAMGNCYDRLAFGHVRDFVHFQVQAVGFDCAIFNFADNMLIAVQLRSFCTPCVPRSPPRAVAVGRASGGRVVFDWLTPHTS